MNKKLWFLIGGILLIAALVGGSMLYNTLSHEHEPPKADIDEDDATAPTQTLADFTVTDQNAQPVKLSDMTGKPVVINFWATWCGYCVAELPAFEEMYQQYGDEVNFMMINVEGYGGAESYIQKYCEENGYTFPVYFDAAGEASTAYKAYSIPLTVFIDKDGNVTDRHTGRMSAATLKQYIEACKRSESINQGE